MDAEGLSTAVGVQAGTKFPTSEETTRLADLDARLAPLRRILDTQTADLDAAQVEWEASFGDRDIDWTALKPIESKSQGSATLVLLEDGSVLATGENPQCDTYELTFRLPFENISALQLEVLPDDSLANKGPGRSDKGNFVLQELQATIAGRPVDWSGVTATHSQQKYDVKGAIDGNPQTGWAILERTGRATQAIFELKRESMNAAEATLAISMTQNYGARNTIGRFRWSVTTARGPIRTLDEETKKAILELVGVAREQRTDQQRQSLAAHFRTIAPQFDVTRRQWADLQQVRDAVVASVRTTLVSTAGTPRMVRVLPRGNWLDESGEVMKPAPPGFLTPHRPSPTEVPQTRLDLTHWLLAPENPLTARVFVNRLWKIAFGQGLVKTVEDFGSQGTPPTHPDLLDWLAVEFMSSGGEEASGRGQGEDKEPQDMGVGNQATRGATLTVSPKAWDVKRILKLIVMSGAYRQSSLADESLRLRDPYNHWLARQGRYRLDAEMVRDNALAVSGLLVHRLGGPSAKPYQPGGYWAYLNFPVREWEADRGEGVYRRGLYTCWCRTFLQPSLKAFDAPMREECTADRPRSNTPLQALVLLNDPTYVEAARAFAERILREAGPSVELRVQFAYRQALSRSLRPDETRLLTALHARHLKQYRVEANASDALLHVGDHPVPRDLDPAELAAWTSVTRAILNLYEAVTRN